MSMRPHTLLSVDVPTLPSAERLLIGRTVEEAAEVLPRLFNLCRTAQEVAARLAFGLTLPPGWHRALAKDIAKDHALKLGVMLPVKLELPPLQMPQNWTEFPQVLLGTTGVPADPDGFEAFLATEQGIAPCLRAVDKAFGAGGCCDPLPVAGTKNGATVTALENSVAARHLQHPVMKHIEVTRGRGPLWRLAARVLDLVAAIEDQLPRPAIYGDSVFVPAARGLYVVRATQEDGRVTSFRRVTPTDHLLADDGILIQSLARVPARNHWLAELLLAILDPCVPVTVKGGMTHA